MKTKRILQLVDEEVASLSFQEVFRGVEGVYSMDGDLAPLNRIVPLCKRHGAILILDDAHGTGVIGRTGNGTAEHFGVQGKVDVTMGTFSKVFGVTGGFAYATTPVIDYLRCFARPYFFSASIPPPAAAAVLAGLDLLEREPELVGWLHQNVQYTVASLRRLGFEVETESPIISLLTPKTMNIRRAAFHFHQAGIFLNSIEYPAVPAHLQRFRISIMATHTRRDLDRLITAIEEVWNLFSEGAPRELAGEEAWFE